MPLLASFPVPLAAFPPPAESSVDDDPASLFPLAASPLEEEEPPPLVPLGEKNHGFSLFCWNICRRMLYHEFDTEPDSRLSLLKKRKVLHGRN